MSVTNELTRYRHISRLGSGGMATVVLAEDTLLGRQVALKRMTATADPRGLSRLRREALVGASVSHRNLVSIYDVVTSEDGNLVIVMEYVRGETLRDALSRPDKLPVGEVLRILEGVAAGLDTIHKRGIVHRDVKPPNILLGADGSVKVADLGIAAVPERTRITTVGSVLGSLSYMAPEQLDDTPSTPAIDIYSLAAVAFEALSGRKARRETNPVALAHAISTQPPPDLREAWPAAPPVVAELLIRGMSRDPAMRPQSAGELIGRLRAALEPEQTAAMATPPAPEPGDAGAMAAETEAGPAGAVAAASDADHAGPVAAASDADHAGPVAPASEADHAGAMPPADENPRPAPVENAPAPAKENAPAPPANEHASPPANGSAAPGAAAAAGAAAAGAVAAGAAAAAAPDPPAAPHRETTPAPNREPTPAPHRIGGRSGPGAVAFSTPQTRRHESRRRLVPALLALVAAAVVIAVLLGTGGSQPNGPGAASASHPSHAARTAHTASKAKRAASAGGANAAAPAGGASASSSSGTSTGGGSTVAGSSTTGSAGASTPSGSTAAGGTADTPVSAVESFYSLAASHNYAGAWALADPTFRSQLGGYQSFQGGQSGDRSITFNAANVVNQSSNGATVAVKTTSVRTDGTHQCSGTVDLLPSGSSGQWLLHMIHINCS